MNDPSSNTTETIASYLLRVFMSLVDEAYQHQGRNLPNRWKIVTSIALNILPALLTMYARERHLLSVCKPPTSIIVRRTDR